MSLLTAAIVDTAALLKVVVASFVLGVGVTAVFSAALFGVARFVDARHDGRLLLAAGMALLAAVGTMAVIGVVVLGIVVMTSK